MKKKEKILIGTLLILLIILGSIYINVKTSNKGSVIQKQETSKAQLTESTGENAYVSTESHLAEVNAQNQELSEINTQISKTTVTAERLLKGYTAYKNGQIITGTMEDRGAVSKTLNAGGSYTIPKGFHNGSGKVIAKDLASQTQATATADDIAEGKTAWVNGQLITGNNSNNADYKKLYIYHTHSTSAGENMTFNTKEEAKAYFEDNPMQETQAVKGGCYQVESFLYSITTEKKTPVYHNNSGYYEGVRTILY